MRLATIAFRNVGRNKLRTFLTILAVTVALIAFVLLRTVIWSWTAAIDQAASDRIATRHKVSFIMTLPKRYVEEIKQMPGVKDAASAVWFGAKYPRDDTAFFATIAVEPTDFLKVYDEVKVDPAQAEAWKQNRRGVLVGDQLMKKYGWKVGDKLVLRGTIYPGDWEFKIEGMYTATRAAVDRSTVYLQYDYLNESVSTRRKDQVGWIVSRIDNAGRSADISKMVDQHFDERDLQTITMSEKALQASFLGMMSAILKAVDVVSFVILVIMMLILGNTIAMGVRERTHEYGVLRAIGFLPKHVVMFIIGESIFVGLIGGVVGLSIAIPFVNGVIGRFLTENMGSMFAFFYVTPSIAVAAFLLAVGFSAIAAIVPARQAAKLQVIDSLRKVG